MSYPNVNQHDIPFQIETMAKLLPTGLLGLYVVGFLVIMGQLSRYGVSSLEIFRMHYLVAGFWCLVPFFIFRVLGPAMRLQQMAWDGKGWSRSEVLKGSLHYLAANLGYLLIVLLIFSFFGYLGLGSSRHVFDWFLSDWKLWLKVVLLVGGSEVSFSYARFFYRRRKNAKEKGGDSPLDDTLSKFAIALFAGLFLVYVGLFSTRIYPQIPHQLGGGKPLSVAFVLARDDLLERPFLILEKNGPQTIPYRLLLERENTLVVISSIDQARAIEFDRKAIAAMIILNDSNSEDGRVAGP